MTIEKISLFSAISFCAALMPLSGCMKWDYDIQPEDFSVPEHGLFVICEGNFQYGNASLSFYDPSNEETQNEVFLRANGFKLGDVAQSMIVHKGLGWIVVNHSHVAFAINTENFREVGRIENLTSPRYMHFVSDDKAYITQLWDNRIFVVNPKRYEITGYITVPDMSMESGSTEQMVQYGKYVFVNCWSYQNRILKIDAETDEIVGQLTVGIQPQSLAIDCNGKLWTATDGGYEGSPYGWEAPQLFKIDAENFEIEKVWSFKTGESLTELQVNAQGNKLYWINDHVWEMTVTSEKIPTYPLINSQGTIYYGLTVSPEDGDVYVADAIDYQQSGKIYRYSNKGELIDEFYVGITPGAFAWKN